MFYKKVSWCFIYTSTFGQKSLRINPVFVDKHFPQREFMLSRNLTAVLFLFRSYVTLVSRGSICLQWNCSAVQSFNEHHAGNVGTAGTVFCHASVSAKCRLKFHLVAGVSYQKINDFTELMNPVAQETVVRIMHLEQWMSRLCVSLFNGAMTDSHWQSASHCFPETCCQTKAYFQGSNKTQHNIRGKNTCTHAHRLSQSIHKK